MPVPGVPVDGWTVVPDSDQSVQPTNQLAISNVKADVDPLLSQRPPIDFTPRTEAPPVVKSPFSILGAPSAATGAFLGSLIDKPGQLGTAAQAGGAAFLKAPFQDVADQPSPSNALRQRGIEMPGVSSLFTDVVLDPTNLVGGEPITGAGKTALAMAAATPGVLKGLKGLTSRILTDVLPQIGKKGATGERIMSLFSKGTVAADELTPALTAWLEQNKHTPISREALEQAVADKGLQLAETTRGTPWAGEEPAGSTKWTQYTLSGGENHRESLIRAIPVAGNPADVTWRELTGDEVLGYAAPRSDVPEMPRVWIANDPERTRITYYPARDAGFGQPYRMEGAHGGSRDYASREAALAAYEHQVQTEGYRYSTPEQRLVKAENGSYHWIAEGASPAIVRPVVPGANTYNVFLEGTQQNYRELPLEQALSSAREVQLAAMPEASLQYKSSHWKNDPNTLVHVRGSDHELEGGGRALHIDEAQSDWHTHETNGGRYYGYMKPNGEWIPPEYTVEKLDDGTVKVAPKAYNKHRRKNAVSATGATEAEALAKLRDQWRATIPPDAPFKGHKADELAFKTWLARAADNGYDALTWTTADQQAERYDRLLRDITAIRLTDEGVLEAKTSNGWKEVEGRFAKPEDTAAVIGQDAAARLAASDKAPSWEFTITDPQGEEKTLKFGSSTEAEEAWDKASAEHSTGARNWTDLTGEQQDQVREAWENDAIENGAYSDSAHEWASNWLDNEVESHLKDAEDEIFNSAKERVLEWAKEENIDVDPDTFEWSRDHAGFRLKRTALRDSHGQPLAPHVQMDIARQVEGDADSLIDELREEKTKELQESDKYYDVMSEGEREAMDDDWRYKRTSEKFELAREHLDSDVFVGDGYEVGDVQKQGGAWHIDLSEHPLTIGSKGMEEEYDKVLPKLAQQISNRYGDGTKVQKLRINAEEAPNIVVARITSTTNDPRRVRLETPDGDTFSRYLPATWESRLAQPDTWVLYDPSGVIQDTAPFASREEAEAAAAAARAKRGPAMHEVWGLPISDKLRSFIKEKGLPLASVLWPAVGSVVTMKDGTRVRVKAHRDDGTFDGTPVTKGTISAQPER